MMSPASVGKVTRRACPPLPSTETTVLVVPKSMPIAAASVRAIACPFVWYWMKALWRGLIGDGLPEGVTPSG